VFLSIGYSACHWCHVLAHESFEDTERRDFFVDIAAEEAHNQMFRDAFNKVQNCGSNRDFGTTKAARMYFSMSDPGPNAFANGDTKPVSFK